MVTLLAEQPDCLWDEALRVGVKELPEDLAALDAEPSNREVLWPIVERFRRRWSRSGGRWRSRAR